MQALPSNISFEREDLLAPESGDVLVLEREDKLEGDMPAPDKGKCKKLLRSHTVWEGEQFFIPDISTTPHPKNLNQKS